MKKIWRMNSGVDINKISQVAEEAGVSRVMAGVLVARKLEDREEIERFLNPKLKNLHSPRLMLDMEKAADIIISAIKAGKRIMVYGDYDCDGVTSTAILFKGLTRCGAKAAYHIPDRIEEGYGMNIEAVEKIARQGYELIVTCDNGIACVEEIRRAKELGLQVVVTDHHEVPHEKTEEGEYRDILPDADAVVNPHRQDDSYPFKYLCGAGIAFKLVHTLYVKLGLPGKELFQYIELAAIGTICDVVDLVDENRIIASIGLRMLNSTQNVGLRALIKASGLEGRKIKAWSIGFVLGPAINATGRLDNASLSVELLLTSDKARADELALELRRLNSERQQMTEEAVERVLLQIENSSIKNQKVLVVYQEDIHESLAGIVAGRIRERYNKPAFVITRGRDGAKGSGRSIEGYNMFEELSKHKDLLKAAGGHAMAAGLSLSEENIPLFRDAINKDCQLTEEDFICKIDVDWCLKGEDVCIELVEELERLEPFGKGNRDVVFMLKNLYIDRIFLMGKNKDSFKLICRDPGSLVQLEAVRFFDVDSLRSLLSEEYGDDMVDTIIANPREVNLKLDILFRPTINEWNGRKSVQLSIIDYRLPC